MGKDQGRPSDTSWPGFLGSTSFSAIYDEDERLKSLYADSPADNGNLESKRKRLFLPNRDSQIRKGAACLALLEDMLVYEPLVSKWQESADISMIAPWTMACHYSLKARVYDQLVGGTNEHKEQVLLDCSNQIFENSLTGLELRHDLTIDGFACLMTSQKLLWEAVGMYFTAVGLAAMTIDDMGAFRSRSSSDMQYCLGKQMLEASDTCKSFCEELGRGNDPELWLVVENTHLCSLVEGDASMKAESCLAS